MNIQVSLSPEAEANYRYLEASSGKRERTIFDAVARKAELIKFDRHYGNPVSKKLIPLEYRQKYGVTNLFRVELPNFWRLLYTLSRDSEGLVAFVLDIIDHEEYDRKFGYRGR